MIPIGKSQQSSEVPYITYLLIAINALVFFFQLQLTPRQLNTLILEWGAIPADLSNWTQDPTVLLTLVTSIFLHGSLFHIISNMLYLGVFGDSVEERIGHFNYLFFYLLGGIGAGLVQVMFSFGSPIPAIGASGAVAAVIGAYVVLYPGSTVLMVILPFFFWVIPIPAFILLGLWFATQLFNGVMSLQIAETAFSGGVAWWAHVGGFVYGALIAIFLRFTTDEPQQQQRQPYLPHEDMPMYSDFWTRG
jgi:membrane associated rhomboid family serine protease